MKKDLTSWSDLKEFCDQLTEEQLKQPVLVAPYELPIEYGATAEVLTEPILYNPQDNEDFGTEEELRLAHGAGFRRDWYQVKFHPGLVVIYTQNEQPE